MLILLNKETKKKIIMYTLGLRNVNKNMNVKVSYKIWKK